MTNEEALLRKSEEEYIFEKSLPVWIERGHRRIGDGCGHTYPLTRIC